MFTLFVWGAFFRGWFLCLGFDLRCGAVVCIAFAGGLVVWVVCFAVGCCWGIWLCCCVLRCGFLLLLPMGCFVWVACFFRFGVVVSCCFLQLLSLPVRFARPWLLVLIVVCDCC